MNWHHHRTDALLPNVYLWSIYLFMKSCIFPVAHCFFDDNQMIAAVSVLYLLLSSLGLIFVLNCNSGASLRRHGGGSGAAEVISCLSNRNMSLCEDRNWRTDREIEDELSMWKRKSQGSHTSTRLWVFLALLCPFLSPCWVYAARSFNIRIRSEFRKN